VVRGIDRFESILFLLHHYANQVGRILDRLRGSTSVYHIAGDASGENISYADVKYDLGGHSRINTTEYHGRRDGGQLFGQAV
jgi:hypothetical protein